MVEAVSQSRASSSNSVGHGDTANRLGGDKNASGNIASRLTTDTSVSQLQSLQAQAKSGAELSVVEQGNLARLEGADAPASVASATETAAAKPTGPVTVADLNVTNATPQDIADLKAALEYLQRTDANGVAVSPTAVALLEGIRDKGTTINIVHDGGDAYTDSTNTIDWDPKSGLALADDAGNLTGAVQSAALGLAHEADHAVNLQSKITNYPSTDPRAPYGNSEEERVITGTENQIARDLGEPIRTNHGGQAVTLGTSTEFLAAPKLSETNAQ